MHEIPRASTATSADDFHIHTAHDPVLITTPQSSPQMTSLQHTYANQLTYNLLPKFWAPKKVVLYDPFY